MLSVFVLAMTVVATLGTRVLAQDARSIVQQPRDVQIEVVDPETKLSRSSFCTGVNMIDVKVTNNTGDRRYVSIINRDTKGAERTLYSGWLETGTLFLSTILKGLELTGPAGTESLRVDVVDYGKVTTGAWMTFFVQDFGGTYPPGGGYPQPGGMVALAAQISPYALAQGSKGTITLQTSAESRPNMTYYFEIMNSWGQFWKRLSINKRPFAPYTVTLPVGTTTKPGFLTYTVNVWLENGPDGKRQKVATTTFSFQVVTPGSATTPYQPGYLGQPGMYAPTSPTWNPYDGMAYPGAPYNPYLQTPYGTGYDMSGSGERAME